MSSGQRRTILNSNERVISDDWNLMQAQQAAQRALVLRQLLGHSTLNRSPVEYPGVDALVAAQPVSTRGTIHDVFGGLMVRPDGGSYLLVDQGVAGMFRPGFVGVGPEDSPYIIVTDAGVTNSTVLTFTANGGGDVRIDVVECRAIDVLVTSSNRDVYDPATETVVPVTVEKIREARLEYRIRLGTPGGGFPDVDQDWLPLAVVVTPTTALSFADCDLYDVRPLVSERGNRYGSFSRPDPANFGGCDIYDRSIPSRAGSVEGWAIGESHGYQIGGQLLANAPATVDGRFNTATTNNLLGGAQAPVTTDGSLNAVLLAFPMGLPRWVRYTIVAAPASTMVGSAVVTGRLPRGPNGIMLMGRPSTLTPKGQCEVVSYPATFGAAATVGQSDLGVVVGWTYGNGSVYRAVDSSGKKHRIRGTTALWPATMSVPALPDGSFTVSSPLFIPAAPSALDWSTNPNRFPATAHSVLLRGDSDGETDDPSVQVEMEMAGGTSASLEFQSESGGNQVVPTLTVISGDHTWQTVAYLECPLTFDESGPPLAHKPGSAPGELRVQMRFVCRSSDGTSQITTCDAFVAITGWNDF